MIVTPTCTHKEIVVEAEWGRYLRIKSTTQHKKEGSPAPAWKREPVLPASMPFALKNGNIPPQPLHPDHPLVAVVESPHSV